MGAVLNGGRHGAAVVGVTASLGAGAELNGGSGVRLVEVRRERQGERALSELGADDARGHGRDRGVYGVAAVGGDTGARVVISRSDARGARTEDGVDVVR